MGKAETCKGKEEDMPLISVIMGVHNSKEDMLRKSVASVLSQTERDFELLICDDGSDNKTKILLKEISATDDRIKIIALPENKGLAEALNTCLDKACGKYIVRQDDDDYSDTERFEKQIEFMENNPDIAFIGTDCNLFDSTGKVYGERKMPKTIDKKSFLYNSPFIHGSMMFRKEVFDDNRYRTVGKLRRYEDYDLFMTLTAKGYSSANMPEKLYNFYFEPAERRISFKARVDEYKVRMEGFKKLGLMPKGFFYALKPLVLGLIPHSLFIKLKAKHGGM
jgi:glycosyltransferase involved in cell wall biosynthesis